MLILLLSCALAQDIDASTEEREAPEPEPSEDVQELEHRLVALAEELEELTEDMAEEREEPEPAPECDTNTMDTGEPGPFKEHDHGLYPVGS